MENSFTVVARFRHLLRRGYVEHKHGGDMVNGSCRCYLGEDYAYRWSIDAYGRRFGRKIILWADNISEQSQTS